MEAQRKSPHTGRQILHTNPMEKDRRPTDKLFFFFFLLIVIAWFIACISGVRTQQGYKEHERVGKIQKYIEAYVNVDIEAFPPRFSGQIRTLLLECAVLCLFCLFLNAIFTKFSVYLGWILYVISTFTSLLTYKSLLFDGWAYPACIITIISIFSIFSISKADKSLLFDLIKDSCRTVMYNPSIIIFTCLISILELPILLFTLQALVSYVRYSNDGEIYLIYNCILMVFGGICVLFSIRNFTVMVISDYTVNYYWKNASIIHSLGRVLRNHVGTIIFSSIPFVRFLCTLVQALKHQGSVKNDDAIIFYYVTKLSLVLDMSRTALTFSSIYGTGFIQSIQISFDTVLRRCLLYLNIFGAVETLFSLNALVVGILPIVVTPSYWNLVQPGGKDQFPREYESMELVFVYVLGYIFTTILTPLLHSVKALAVNKIIILNKEDQDTERKTGVLDHL